MNRRTAADRKAARDLILDYLAKHGPARTAVIADALGEVPHNTQTDLRLLGRKVISVRRKWMLAPVKKPAPVVAKKPVAPMRLLKETTTRGDVVRLTARDEIADALAVLIRSGALRLTIEVAGPLRGTA